MLATFFIVLPVFGLIFVGWLARRIGILGPNATTELNRFVVYLALPALLFDIVANAKWAELWQPKFIGSFGAGVAMVFVLMVLVRLGAKAHLADAAIDGLNAAYGNTGYLGFPLVLTAIGQDAMAPTLVATILTVCIVFGVAITLIEIGLQTERHPAHLVKKVGGALLRNPLLASPMVAAIFLLAGLHIPAAAESFLKLLGGAASPCALVALGLFLAAERTSTAHDTKRVATLVLLKLAVHPVITWLFATQIFGLPPFLTHTAVLVAALPTGTGPFMLAEFYGRDASVTSQAILLSTIASVFTVSLYLAVGV